MLELFIVMLIAAAILALRALILAALGAIIVFVISIFVVVPPITFWHYLAIGFVISLFISVKNK